jgi:hypothetical protein
VCKSTLTGLRPVLGWAGAVLLGGGAIDDRRRRRVFIDCIVIENVGLSGHRVHFNGQGNSGQEYYGTIDDTESRDEVAVGFEPFDGPCDADTFFSEHFSGPGIVVAG